MNIYSSAPYGTPRPKEGQLLLLLLLLLSRFSCVQLCATPEMAAHQAPPSLGFSRQEHWSGLPFPSPMHESEKWKWSRSVVSNSSRPHGLQPTRLLCPRDFPGKSTGVGCQKDSNNCNNSGTSLAVPWLRPHLPVQGLQVCSLAGYLRERAMAPHSSTLAWQIPWTEDPGGLQSMGSQSRTAAAAAG